MSMYNLGGKAPVNDWNKLARGRPSLANIQDPETRRALTALYQEAKYLNLKVRDIRKRPDDYKFPLTDVSKNPKKREPKLPEAVMTLGEWFEPDLGNIEGMVNPKGSSCQYYFQYMWVPYDKDNDIYPPADFTNANTIQTATKSAGSGMVRTSVQEALVGLQVPALYYVQIVAWNSVGKVWSNIISFLTGKLPDVVLNSADNISLSSARLSGTVDPNSLDAQGHFEWGETPACVNNTDTFDAGAGTNPIAEIAGLTSLVENTWYYFKLVAYNAVGPTKSEIKKFKTLRRFSPTVKIISQTNTDVSANLTGSVKPNGYETTWYFLYGSTHGLVDKGGGIIVDEVSGPDTLQKPVDPPGNAGSGIMEVPVSIDFIDLIPGHQYYAQLIGVNANGTAYSDIWGFTTNKAEILLTGNADMYAFVGDSSVVVALPNATVRNSGPAISTLNWMGALTNMDAAISSRVLLSMVPPVGPPIAGALASGDSNDFFISWNPAGMVTAGSWGGTVDITAGPYIDHKTIPISVKLYNYVSLQFTIKKTTTNKLDEGSGYSWLYPGDGPYVSSSSVAVAPNQESHTGYYPTWYLPYALMDGYQPYVFRNVTTHAWIALWDAPVIMSGDPSVGGPSGTATLVVTGHHAGSEQPSYSWTNTYEFTFAPAG